MSRHMFRKHVGHQGFVPPPHLIHLLLLLVDLEFPQEQGTGQLLHLQTEGGTSLHHFLNQSHIQLI